jgi:hypothetical protein
MNSSTSVALVPVGRCFADGDELALAGFLAGYRGSTRGAYALDLRQFIGWCAKHERRLFEVHRVDIEFFRRRSKPAGGLERRSPAGCARSPPSTATRRRKA